jgi:mycothiol synthase
MDDGYRSRPATGEDRRAIAEVFTVEGIDDHGRLTFPAEDLVEYIWGSFGFDPALDGRTIESPDGLVVAFASLYPSKDPAEPADGTLTVHPGHRGRGLGRELVEWLEGRALATGARALRMETPAANVGRSAMLSRLGYEHVRTFWTMQRDLAPDEPFPQPPPGIRIRTFQPGDEAAAHATITEAFREHFGHTPETLEEWVESHVRLPGFDPMQFFLAVEGDEVVALLYQITRGEVAYVASLGTRQGWRGRGIAKTLLRHSFADLARRGLKEVTLSVDSSNATGATRLYEGVGMKVDHGWNTYDRQLETAAEASSR